MKVRYECEYCGMLYSKKEDCAKCEMSHLTYTDKIIYDLILKGKDPCDFCEHSYYVYGCERDCEKRCSNHKQFKPTNPLHDKRIRGV